MRRDTRKSERSTLHHLSVAQQNFGCFQPRLLRYRSRSSRSAGYSINLPASTRLRRRSNGKPCIVCKTGRAPTAIVVPAQVLELGKGAGELSISFGSPHLKQKGIRRLCTTTWERRCRHVGSWTTASPGLAWRDDVVGWWQRAVSRPGGVWVGCVSGSPDLTQNGIQRPCTKAWERRCWHVGLLLTASAGSRVRRWRGKLVAKSGVAVWWCLSCLSCLWDTLVLQTSWDSWQSSGEAKSCDEACNFWLAGEDRPAGGSSRTIKPMGLKRTGRSGAFLGAHVEL
jgi:hypothetical protein